MCCSIFQSIVNIVFSIQLKYFKIYSVFFSLLLLLLLLLLLQLFLFFWSIKNVDGVEDKTGFQQSLSIHC